MKKILALILSVLLLVMGIPFAALATDGATEVYDVDGNLYTLGDVLYENDFEDTEHQVLPEGWEVGLAAYSWVQSGAPTASAWHESWSPFKRYLTIGSGAHDGFVSSPEINTRNYVFEADVTVNHDNGSWIGVVNNMAGGVSQSQAAIISKIATNGRTDSHNVLSKQVDGIAGIAPANFALPTANPVNKETFAIKLISFEGKSYLYYNGDLVVSYNNIILENTTDCVGFFGCYSYFNVDNVVITAINPYVEPAAEATVAYYVGDAQEGEAVTGLFEGDAYIPDRTPETAAPEGKYFAGWKDANGNWAGKEGFVLEAGENKLYAVYNSYVYSTTSSGELNYANDAAFAYPSYDPNGENFMNYVDGFGSYLNFTAEQLDGETVLKVNNSNTWNARANFILPNADGSAMVIEPGQTYKITVTYKVPDYKGSIQMLFGSGFGFVDSVSNTFTDRRTFLNTPFQGIAKNNAILTSTTDPNLSTTSTGWTYIWLGGAGHDAWAITGASTEWQTATFTLSTSEDYTGFLPLIQGAINLGGSAEMYIKEFTVKNANAVDPATVVVKANGEVEETFENYKEGDTFAIDRMPNVETPEGKYFAGWMHNGKFVVDVAVLGAGENVIEAVYKDYASGEITADLKEANLPKTSEGAAKVILPSIVEDVYQNHVLSGGWTATADASDETGEYLRFYTDDAWASNSLKVLRYNDGSAIIAKPETEYTISVTYRLGKFPETYTATWEDFTNNGGARASMMMYVMVGFDPTIRNSFQNNNGQTGYYGKAVPTEHATWYDNGFGLGLWTDVCADGWVTETFKITTKDLEQYEADGLIPAFTLYTGVASNTYEVHIKDVTIVEHVHDWVADPESDKAPTCVEHGKAAYKCDCGQVKYEELEDELIDHDYSVNDGLTCSICKDSLAPVAPVAAKVTANSVTLVEFAGLEYSIDGVIWQASATFTGLTAETEYTFYQRVAASDIANAGAMSEALVVTTEAGPDFIPGDVDGNGAVNSADLAILKKVIANLTPLDDPSVVNPDVDISGSATPNAADLAQLKKIIASLV